MRQHSVQITYSKINFCTILRMELDRDIYGEFEVEGPRKQVRITWKFELIGKLTGFYCIMTMSICQFCLPWGWNGDSCSGTVQQHMLLFMSSQTDSTLSILHDILHLSFLLNQNGNLAHFTWDYFSKIHKYNRTPLERTSFSWKKKEKHYSKLFFCSLLSSHGA